MVMMMMRESSRKKGESQRKSRSSIYVLDTPHTTDDVKIKVMRRSFLWSYNATLTRVCDKDLASKRERWIRVRVKETAQSGRFLHSAYIFKELTFLVPILHAHNVVVIFLFTTN